MGAFTEATPTRIITLDGKPRELGFTMGAMRRAEELGVLQLEVTDPVVLMLKLPEYVWCCLPKAVRKELSVEDIAELLNPTNITEIAAAVDALFRLSVPDPEVKTEPAAEKEPTAGNQSTSTSSGRSASTISDYPTVSSGGLHSAAL